MSQRFSLYEDLTVGENIDFFSGIYGVAAAMKRQRKDWALEMAGLKDLQGSLARTLPGGFRQRLALGCSILHEPPILFLDEPTSGVDPISRRNFWGLIYDLSESGTTVFVTTHYMDEADYCERLALIYRGRLVAQGSPLELKQQYMTNEVIEIEVDRAFEALEALLDSGIEAALFGNQLHATVESHSAAAPLIRETLEARNIVVSRIQRIEPSLEDVFVSLVEER